jgi:hypothetical protein
VASLTLVLRCSFSGWSIVGIYSRCVLPSSSAAFRNHCLSFSSYIMHFPTTFITTYYLLYLYLNYFRTWI